MVLITHILLAIISIVSSLYTLFSPSQNKIRLTYLLTFGTIISGVGLVITSPQNLGQTCITGGLYLGFFIITSLISHKRIMTNKI